MDYGVHVDASMGMGGGEMTWPEPDNPNFPEFPYVPERP